MSVDRKHSPEPRTITVAALQASLEGLPLDAVVLFEMPNQTTVSVRSARHGLAHPFPRITIAGDPSPDRGRLALVLKG